MTTEVSASYDRQADAIYVRLSSGQYRRGVDLDEARRVDYDVDGDAIGVELLFVSHGVELQSLPRADAIAAELATLHIRILAA